VQEFRATDAGADINRRLFVAGLLVTAALGLLLEALVTRRTFRRDT
jgi:hypothetical protein